MVLLSPATDTPLPLGARVILAYDEKKQPILGEVRSMPSAVIYDLARFETIAWADIYSLTVMPNAEIEALTTMLVTRGWEVVAYAIDG